MIAAQELYGHKGRLDRSEGFFAAPLPLTEVAVKHVNNIGRTHERPFLHKTAA
ncbi:MAG: hypothetical protein ACLPLP_06080 [Mycobacterium sp.]